MKRIAAITEALVLTTKRPELIQPNVRILSITRPSADVILRIEKLVAEGLPLLAPHLRAWAETHLIEPRVVTLFTGLDSSATEDFWLVTGDIGKDDSSYRVIYTEDLESFGLSVILQNGRHCCLGFYGQFAEAIVAM